MCIRDSYKELGLNSETAVVFNITSKEQVIVNTWDAGEMKKGMFSLINYFLPLKGMAAMHCSANTDLNGENTAIFFGLSGTGKTKMCIRDRSMGNACVQMIKPAHSSILLQPRLEIGRASCRERV